jgi:hypothetical protein
MLRAPVLLTAPDQPSVQPRYVVRPSFVLPDRWIVFDTESGGIVRARGHAVFTERSKADAFAARLCRESTRRAVCRSCRHRQLAASLVGGVCAQCRAPRPDPSEGAAATSEQLRWALDPSATVG